MIRAATLEDLSVLIALGEAMHAESPRFSRLEFSSDRLAQTLVGLVEADRGFLWVAENAAGSVIGGMAAVIVPHWCSNDLIATDLALFIEKTARGSLAPMRLLHRYRRWAVERGAVLIQIGVSSGIDTETTAHLYEQLGFSRCGVILEA